MNKIIDLFRTAGVVVLLVAANLSLAEPPDPASEAWALIGSGALLIDVRSAQEFSEGHIEGAINIPHEQTDELVAAIGPDHDRDVVLYCGSGRRAGLVIDELHERGYTAVHNASGYQDLLDSRP